MKFRIIISFLALTSYALNSQDLDSIKHHSDLLIQELTQKYEAEQAIYSIVFGDQLISGGSKPDAPDMQFRVASVTKILTTVAILKLVNQGRLDLGEDIRKRVAFKASRNYNQPVTLEHLLTHTSGIDNSDIGDAANEVSGLLTLEELLAKKEIKSIYGPGLYWRYSNYNFVLLGRLIEEVTGQAYPDAMKELIFEPFGMTRSDFRQSPESWPADYMPPRELELSQVIPADGLNTTASDMALLIKGVYSDSLLCEQLFHQRFGYGLNLPGQGYGLRLEPMGKTRRLSGKSRIFTHPGSIQGFKSDLVFVPELKMGLFASTYKGPARVNFGMTNELLTYFFKGQNFDEYTEQKPDFDINQLTGTYLKQNVNRSTVEEFGSLISKDSFFKIRTDGSDIVVNEDQKMVFIGADTWVILETGQRLIIKEYNGGLHIFQGLSAYRKIGFLGQRSVQMIIFFGSQILFLIAAIIGLKKKLFNKSLKWITLAQMLTVLTVAITVTILAEGRPHLDFGLPLEIRFVQALIKVLTILTLISVLFQIIKLRKGKPKLMAAAISFSILLAATAQIGWFWNWWNISLI